eukprot:m.227452 g.227452  ORF g.227452 m.227452 type:complete len:78 (+) comp15177_c0_seq8:455-688(+)
MMHLITFGAPPLGCARFADVFHQARQHGHSIKITRWVTTEPDGQQDKIPNLPIGYNHVAPPVILEYLSAPSRLPYRY